ncbi:MULTISPECIES: TIGR02266 family protein [Myxococcus]|uniref:TIGR02266 family protein n=1 Tax=Myxococcus llanfairpwllgwyngyllgogerychwyrndrobwllllantysiliogogogochensis TaxID=2590453 RepID=A0A540X9E5_9BACT|nr:MULTISPECIES: TIGR02266 family protein [Myxococcus]NTX02638.1 TIGR02266 family protein [Myxococcus sp. CA040A]NTX11059.1 TIGR02266 family protein [Myxococcus sp. CA056]NTX40844.1 TIGR02266 family protein [Myxococcus sp. CA033]NTX50435.1 TIGR02266 family protein [Myxococcus sp. CA039A]TQF17925.1 TIGR02266 family protein [Myxococcus llanfairpwllgwyngyllgogerychwyrndrobwllllantysiliogogogochensis]
MNAPTSTTREAVFVVDDSRTAREVVRLHLARLGCEPVTLDGGEACLSELARRAPMLILMDLRMERMQGDEVCRAVKAHPAGRNVPVIMFTSAGEPHEVMHCWRAGADDFLPKPVALEALQAKLVAVRGARERAKEGPPKGRRMLLVEGGRFLHTFLGGALEQEGLHVLYARDAVDAEKLASEHAALLDGFLVDVSRAPRETLALATKLREANPKKPLVLLSRAEESADVLARAQVLAGAPLLEKRHLGADELLGRVLSRLVPERVPLRAAERVPFFTVVEFAPVGGGATLTGFSHDASPDALFVRTLTPAREGTRLTLKVLLAGQRTPCSAEATVVWSNPPRTPGPFRAPAGMGLRLERMDPALTQQFVRFVPRTHGFSPSGTPRSSGF